MRIEKVNLIKDDPNVTLTCYVSETEAKHDALLVIPGGGYGVVCIEHEGYPIAELLFLITLTALCLPIR